MAQPKRKDLDEMLQQTFDDRRLSRSEKRALASVWADFDLGPEDRAYIRHRAFLLAIDSVDSSADRSVLKWLEDVVKVVHSDRAVAHSSATVHFSPGDECRLRIARLLKTAKRSIDICVFTVTDDRLSNEILDAHRRGVRVRLLSDNDKAEDRGADVNRLEEAGLAVAVDATEHHMHHKFALFDNSTVVTGSYNWTRSAAKFNHENIVVSDDPQIVRPYQKKFEELWEELAKPTSH